MLQRKKDDDGGKKERKLIAFRCCIYGIFRSVSWGILVFYVLMSYTLSIYIQAPEWIDILLFLVNVCWWILRHSRGDISRAHEQKKKSKSEIDKLTFFLFDCLCVCMSQKIKSVWDFISGMRLLTLLMYCMGWFVSDIGPQDISNQILDECPS